jgi:hypothetical protein
VTIVFYLLKRSEWLEVILIAFAGKGLPYTFHSVTKKRELKFPGG